MCSTNNFVFMSRPGELIKPLAIGDKAVSVSSFNGPRKIHIRRYFSESVQKQPTRYGITMSKQEFVDLVSLSNVVLTELERLEFIKTDNIVASKPAEKVTTAQTTHIPDVVVGAIVVVDGVEVPFGISDLATLASQLFYGYDDRCASLETQFDDADDIVSCDVVDTVIDESAEMPIAIGDLSTFASQPQYSYDSPCPSRNSRNIGVRSENPVVDPTFPHTLPWNIDDAWCTWGSQLSDDEQAMQHGSIHGQD